MHCGVIIWASFRLYNNDKFWVCIWVINPWIIHNHKFVIYTKGWRTSALFGLWVCKQYNKKSSSLTRTQGQLIYEWIIRRLEWKFKLHDFKISCHENRKYGIPDTCIFIYVIVPVCDLVAGIFYNAHLKLKKKSCKESLTSTASINVYVPAVNSKHPYKTQMEIMICEDY